MTRNQRYVTKIMNLLNKGDNANIEYDAYRDEINFWFNYGVSGVQRITIPSNNNEATTKKRMEEITNIIKNELVEREH